METFDYANQIASHHHPSESEKLSNIGVATTRPVSFFYQDPRTHRAKPKELNP